MAVLIGLDLSIAATNPYWIIRATCQQLYIYNTSAHYYINITFGIVQEVTISKKLQKKMLKLLLLEISVLNPCFAHDI